MIRFVHCADIHLDSPLRGLVDDGSGQVGRIRQATRTALSALVDFCQQEAVDFLLIAGDLYDGDWRDFSTGLFFVQQMARLRRAGIPVYLISGNHDAHNQMTRRLPLPENVFEFSSQAPQSHVLEALGVAIHGQSYARRDVTENLALQYPAPVPGYLNIGLLHTALAGREGHATYAPCALTDLHRRGYQYWALGHVHQQEIVSQEPCWVVFPGNLQGRHIRETGPKGCMLVQAEADRIVSVEPVALDGVRWALARLDAEPLASAAEFWDACRQTLADCLRQADGRLMAVRFEAFGCPPGLLARLGRPAHWRETLISIAADLAGDQLWLEEAMFRPVSQAVAPDGMADETLLTLDETVAQLLAEPDRLAEFTQALAAFENRLPSAVFTSADAVPAVSGDPDTLRALLVEVAEGLKLQLIAGTSSDAV